MKQRSLKTNAILNGIKSTLSLIVPLIIFPYVSRILHVENIGKYNFALTYVGYYSLVATLGVTPYVTREGVKYRDDKAQMSVFTSEIYTLNMIATFLSVFVLLLSLLFFDKISEYRIYILCLAPTIVFTTYGVDWMFTVYEDYLYVTIRSIVLQVFKILFIFIFIKTENDLIKYCIIYSSIILINCVLNRYKANSYCLFKLCINRNIIKHLKPILILFASAIALSIYTSSDITILGIMKGDYEVGLYSVSVKIYNIFKTLFSALLVVSVPRLSKYLAEHKYKEYNNKFSNIFIVMITLVVPSMIGLFFVAEDIILLVSGEEYIKASSSLKILSIALIICFLGWIYSSCVIIPYGKDKQFLFALSLSGMINVILNILLIPSYGQDATAFTTLIAEFISLVACWRYSKGLIKLEIKRKDIVSIFIGNISIVVCCIIISKFNMIYPFGLIIKITISVISYGIIMLLFKNSAVEGILNTIKNKYSLKSIIK